MTPDGRTANEFRANCIPAGHSVLKATDVEDDLTVFTSASDATLLLHNRYDGIDLPDHDCRMAILSGLPARGDLQERFLYSALGAHEVLQERVKARIVQGSGRATRNSRDYAVVVVLGDNLVQYATRQDILASLHPEVHAEIEFGLRNSLGVPLGEIREQLAIFTEQGAQWREVNQDILADRDRFSTIQPPGVRELQESARHEVLTWEAIWQGDWNGALLAARSALDALTGGRAPQRYAALWNYLASNLALRHASTTRDPSLIQAAGAFYQAARKAGRGTTWLAHLTDPARQVTINSETGVDPLDTITAANIVTALKTVGQPSRFEPLVVQIHAALTSTPARPYERSWSSWGPLPAPRTPSATTTPPPLPTQAGSSVI
jgi:hypothetical protein